MASNTKRSPLERLPPAEDLLRALGLVVLVNVVGGVPAILGGPDTEWFAALAKPAFYPPGVTFGIVWTILFTLLGIALFLIVRDGLADRTVKVAVGLFVVQMALNVAWTPTFFAAQSLAGGLVVIVALFVVLLPTTWAFARVDRRAAALLVPYLAWVAFAALLNYRILVLN
jgi:tryptophan-rich sensory protein